MRSRVNSRGVALAAIAVGLLWAIGNTSADDPQPDRVLLVLAGFVLAAFTLTSRLAPVFVGWYAVLIALSERLTKVPLDNYSDVLRATREALDVVIRQNGNPYTHVMTNTSPIASPFPYPPGEFLFYLPWYLLVDDISRVDLFAGVITTACIVIVGFRVGFDRVVLPAMLYATWLYSSFHSGDGSNDTSAALLVVVAITLLSLHERWPRRWLFILSAISFGWAIAFKQFALFLLVPVVRGLGGRAPWRPYLGLAAATVAAFALPFLIRDPGAFFGQQVAALTFHTERSGVNLAAGLAGIGLDLPPAVFVGLELAAAAFGLLACALVRTRSLGRATLAGAGTLTAVILLARWTSQDYWLYVGAVGLLGIALVDDAESIPA